MESIQLHLLGTGRSFFNFGFRVKCHIARAADPNTIAIALKSNVLQNPPRAAT
jgi:hypothetical protein